MSGDKVILKVAGLVRAMVVKRIPVPFDKLLKWAILVLSSQYLYSITSVSGTEH